MCIRLFVFSKGFYLCLAVLALMVLLTWIDPIDIIMWIALFIFFTIIGIKSAVSKSKDNEHQIKINVQLWKSVNNRTCCIE